jgi:hypothetical protein
MPDKVIFIVVVGNPAQGFTTYGPFSSGDEATAWAEQITDDTWWVDTLIPPTQDVVA